jgi:hypothetical protein
VVDTVRLNLADEDAMMKNMDEADCYMETLGLTEEFPKHRLARVGLSEADSFRRENEPFNGSDQLSRKNSRAGSLPVSLMYSSSAAAPLFDLYDTFPC